MKEESRGIKSTLKNLIKLSVEFILNLEKQEACSKMTTIAGQAVIEGLMMIGPEKAAIAVRKPDGEIVIERKPTPKKGKLGKIPLVRGGYLLILQMVLGIKALMFAADQVELEEAEEEPSKFEKFLTRIFKDKVKDILIYMSVIISLGFSIGLFMLLPYGVANIIPVVNENTILFNVVEGVIRVGLFFGYLMLASQMKDIKRVWQYHGSEHKTIHCYEAGKELTVENIKGFSTKHPRCGTSFLFTVMIISILVFSIVGIENFIFGLLARIILIPLVAGLSYEVFRIVGKYDNFVTIALRKPGLVFQKFTTKEPDEEQIEVAIVAMKEAMPEEKDADKW